MPALTLVNDHLLQLPLGRCPLQDLLVDGVGGDQAVNHHWFGLTDAVAAVLSLQVGLRVLEDTAAVLSRSFVPSFTHSSLIQVQLLDVSLPSSGNIQGGGLEFWTRDQHSQCAIYQRDVFLA